MRLSSLSALLLISIFLSSILTLTACSSINYETNIHEVKEEFDNISIKTDSADIDFAPSDDGMCKIACYENARKRHSVEVINDTLVIEMVDAKKWYDRIGVNIDLPKITVYIPESEYSALIIEQSTGDIQISKDFNFKSIDISLSTGDVKCYASATENIKITASTGDIYAEGISAGSLDFTVSTGKVTVSDITCDTAIAVGVSTGNTYLTDIACKNLTSIGTTGAISLKNVNSAERITIERSTGDVILENSDAKEFFITTSTGDVTGNLLTDKVFITQTNTGNVTVPNSVTGGKCEITTTTGDIKISISNN